MAKVLAAFKDAKDPSRKLYKAGDNYEGTPERIAELAAKGFVEKQEPAKPKAEKKPAKKAAKKS